MTHIIVISLECMLMQGYVIIKNWADMQLLLDPDNPGHCILFCTYGIVVFWNTTANIEDKMLDYLRKCSEPDMLLEEAEEKDQFDW